MLLSESRRTIKKVQLKEQFDSVAHERAGWRNKYAYYHRELEKCLRFLIPENSSVLEIGTGTGDLLASLNPSRGFGIDISKKMIEIAGEKFPHLEFAVGDLENLNLSETFDYVVIANALGYLEDILSALSHLKTACRPDTRIIIVYYSNLWKPIIKLAERMGWRMKWPEQHWLSMEDIENLLHLKDYEVVKRQYRFLLPLYVPAISLLLNKYIGQLPFFRRLALNHILVAHPLGLRKPAEEVTCSVIVPCRNEKENIEPAILTIPKMGMATEIVLVEGHSKDGTYAECERIKQTYPEKRIKVLIQDGEGKGDAVRKGLSHATGDVVMIFDADCSVEGEALKNFFDAIVSGRGEFINGSRLVYQMEKYAMRFLNMVGNKIFSILLTFLLDQYLKDTLCGTKVLWRDDYLKIAAGRHYFGDFDPFGDFDLLFGASKLNLKIAEIPVHYRERIYGSTQIKRFQHGWRLLKMTLFATWKLKFI